MPVSFPFHVDIRVRGYEIDSWGHVNNAVYLQWLEHARWEMAGSSGFAALFGDILPVVRHLELDYQHETLLGDELRVWLWPRTVKTTSFTLGAIIRITGSWQPERVGKQVMQATMIFACMRPHQGKIAVPDGWRQYFPASDPGPQLPADA